MMYKKLLIFLYFLHIVSCDWMSDWMRPMQGQLHMKSYSRPTLEGEVAKAMQMNPEILERLNKDSLAKLLNSDVGFDLREKLENTIRDAVELSGKLEVQITTTEKKERSLKEAIVNGRLGMSVVTVSTVSSPVSPTYLVRDGAWTICNGVVQSPLMNSSPGEHIFHDIFATPMCIGREVPVKPDPCVFNSVIKYEVVPKVRRTTYDEDEVFCLKPGFNKPLERYMSVPRAIVNTTCNDGVVRSNEDNLHICGGRILSEYTYYPNKVAGSYYPLEYCTEKNGACKLISAWHMANSSVQHFEFLRDDPAFKKIFIKPSGFGPYLKHMY